MMSEISGKAEVHDGGCLCGSLRFQTAGAPLKTTICHCPMCQRASGSAFTVELIFLAKAVTFQGTPSIYTHRSPDHGRSLHYLFCSTCGTRLGVSLERFAGLQFIYAGTYDDTSWVKPDSHIFTRSATAWARIPDDVDCFSAHMMDERGISQQPMSRKL
jgi:hypothetical protein